MTNALERPLSTLARKASGIIDQLGLSQDEVGQIVNASSRTVARWIAGAAAPQPMSKKRLLELAYVAEALTEVLPQDRANAWILSPNRLLDHESPADRIRDGGYRDVLGLIDAIAEGVVV